MTHLKDRTPEQLKFLTALSNGHTVTEAASLAHVGRRTLYDLRDREPGFRSAWDDAIAAGTDLFEEEVRHRALDRNDRYSHLLLMFMLKARDPRWKDSHKVEQTVRHETVQEISFSDKEMSDAIDILTAAKTASSPVSE